MKNTVIRSEISGLSAAWLLKSQNQMRLYKAADYPGGHTKTVSVTLDSVTDLINKLYKEPFGTPFMVTLNLPIDLML